jgi:RNA polymerase primary sigma factor
MRKEFVSKYDLSIFNRSTSPDIVALFLMDVREVPLLTAEEEVHLAMQVEAAKGAKKKLLSSNKLTYSQKEELIEKIEHGRDACNLLVTANSRLVIQVAKKYTWTGLTLLDLVQEGHIGLIKAIEKYDHRLGYRFSTYAKWWIWQTISRGIASTGRTIRLPTHLMDDILRLSKTKSDLTNTLGRQPTEAEICKSMNISIKRLEKIKDASQKIRSLDEPVNYLDDTEFGELLADDHDSLEEEVATKQLRDKLEEGMSILTAKEKIVLRLLYGFENHETATLDAISERLGISKERVRQIKVQAMMKLRKWANHNHLDYF